MTAVVQARRDALEPLRAALTSRARAEAERLRVASEADAQQVMDDAGAEARTLLARARRDGEEEAAAAVSAQAAQARQVARGLVLAAQRAAYDALRERTRDAVRGLLQDPDRRARLAAALRRRLGHHACVHDHQDGGLLVTADDGRSIDASVGALVDAAMSEMDLHRLWDTR